MQRVARNAKFGVWCARWRSARLQNPGVFEATLPSRRGVRTLHTRRPLGAQPRSPIPEGSIQMRSFSKHSVLGGTASALLATLSVACGGGGGKTEPDVGVASIAVTSVPSDVRCIRIA